MIGKPKFNIGDTVSFTIINAAGKLITKTGVITIIDRYGCFMDDSDVCYDITVPDDEHRVWVGFGEDRHVETRTGDCMYKHINEYLIIIPPLTDEEVHTRWPFLKCNPESEWCPGNSDEVSWWHNLSEDYPGWENAFGRELMDEIKACLVKYDCLDKFEVNQIKEKWGALRFYWSGEDIPDECYKELNAIINEYEKISSRTCHQCGRPAKYRTKGYILPYCQYCIKAVWNVTEISEE